MSSSRARPFPGRLPLPTAAFVLGLALAPAAQGVRLSRARLLTVGDVSSGIESPDGRWVVYGADQDLDGVSELYSVPSDGSALPVKLNGPLPPGGGVFGGKAAWKVTPGSDRVVYCASHPTTGVATLFSVPIAGGPSIQLSGGSPVDTTLVEAFQISPDGARIVYSSGYRLHGVSSGGGPSVQLSGSLRAGGGHGSFFYGSYGISADSSRVVFTSDEELEGVLPLHSCPIAGGAVVRLSPRGDEFAGAWALHPDGARIVFASSRRFLYQQTVCCAPLDGSRKALRVTPEHASITSLQLDPAGERVAYVAYGSGASLELYSALIPPPRLRGSPPRETRLTPAVPFVRGPIDFRISPGGARVVYRAEQGAAGQMELFSSPLDESLPVRLNPALPAAGDVGLFRLSADGSTVFYTADSAADDAFHLFRVPITGGASTQLSPQFTAGGSVSSFELHPTSARAVYLADQELDGVVELYSVPDAGGPATRLNSALYPGLGVQSFLLGASGRVAYLADQDENETRELFTVPVAGGAAVKLNLPLPQAEVDDVSRFLLDPAGTNALYLADEDTDAWPEVYSAPLDGSTPAVKVGLAPSFLGAVSLCDLMPGGTHLLVLAASTGYYPSYYTAPLDGSAPPLLIAPPPPERFLNTPSIAPAGDRIVYFASSGYDSDLYSARTDGSLSTARLDDGSELPRSSWIVAAGTRVLYLGVGSGYRLRSIPIDGGARTDIASVPSGRYIEGVLLTPDLTRAVFRADKDTAGTFELYGVPVDGSAPALRLNTPLPGGRDVHSRFALSADGARVVYAAEQDTAGVLQLFSAPVDGSAPPVKLSGTLALQENGYGAPIFQVSSTGRAVFARLEGRELYSAPLDGSSAPVLVSTPMVPGGRLYPGGEWTPFEISPDGLGVAYVADQDVAGVFELYGAPIDGSAAPRKLSPALGTSGRVLTSQRNLANGASPGLHFSADGQRVAYEIASWAGGIPAEELYVSPLDASQPARRLHPALVPGGAVRYVEVHGSRALYLADQDVDEVIELYGSEL